MGNKINSVHGKSRQLKPGLPSALDHSKAPKYFAAIFEVLTSGLEATFHAGAKPEPFRHLSKRVVLKQLPPDETGQAVDHHLPLS